MLRKILVGWGNFRKVLINLEFVPMWEGLGGDVGAQGRHDMAVDDDLCFCI